MVIRNPLGSLTSNARLPQSVSITGTRYRKDGITVWTKGERATLRRAGKRIECKVQ